MPVDKFGRTDVGSSQRVVSGGVTLSQVNNTFLRRDGENTATGNIDMNSRKLINVLDPDNAQDVATRNYVDNKVLLPSKKFLAPYATDLNIYEWKYYQTIPEGLIEGDFDNLPSGLYACYTGYLPNSRLGNLPRNTKGYLIAMTYQQPADRNKYYKWINSTNGDEWSAYFRQNTWNTWIKSDKVSKVGDTMTGDLALTTTGSNATRNLGCKTITNGGTFNLWLGTPNVKLVYTDFLKYLQLVIDGGFQIANAGGILFNIGINPNPLNAATFYVPIEMGGRAIVGVADPANAQDAATKNYVDSHVGIVASFFKTATGTLQNTPHMHIVLLTFPGGKSMTGGKIRITELWVERGQDEWYATSCARFNNDWVGFHSMVRESSYVVKFRSINNPNQWTRNYRLEYIELP